MQPRNDVEDELLAPNSIDSLPAFIEQSKVDTFLTMLQQHGYLRFNRQGAPPEVAAKAVLALARRKRLDIIATLNAQMLQTEGLTSESQSIYRI